jgi:hypothetical protein
VDCCLAFLDMLGCIYVFYDYHGRVSLVSSSSLSYGWELKRDEAERSCISILQTRGKATRTKPVRVYRKYNQSFK